MHVLATALVASFLHFLFFLMESVFWGTRGVNRIFKLAPEVAKSPAVRLFAFNMGFYNLFLSLGTLAALKLLEKGCCPGGVTLLAFCTSCMVAAGFVLLLSGGLRRLPAALIQSGPPAACLYFLFCNQ